jgi:ferrous iron transport protein B
VIDARKLEKILGVPVVPTIASKGKGIQELVKKVFEVAGQRYRQRQQRRHGEGHLFVAETSIKHTTRYSSEVEARIENLTRLIDSEQLKLEYPSRWLAIKLLEGDSKIKELVGTKSKNVVEASETFASQIENVYQQPRYVVMASERYALASQIAQNVQNQKAMKRTFSDKLDRLATDKVFGYILAFVVVAGLLVWTFTPLASFNELTLR